MILNTLQIYRQKGKKEVIEVYFLTKKQIFLHSNKFS